MKNFLALISILIFLMFSCTTNPENDISIENYMPLAIGNTWRYESIYDTNTVYIITITDEHIVNGNVVWEATFFYDGDVVPHYYTYKDGELRHWFNGINNSQHYFVELKEPLEIGNKWATDTILSSPQNEDTLRVTDIGLSVTVEAGSFDNCIKIESKFGVDGGVMLLDGIYAPDIGMITERSGGDIMELVWYDVK